MGHYDSFYEAEEREACKERIERINKLLKEKSYNTLRFIEDLVENIDSIRKTFSLLSKKD